MKPLTRRVCCAARDREPAGRLARLCRCLAVAAIVLAAARSTVDAEPAGRPRVLELVVDVSGSTLAEQGGVAPPSGGACAATLNTPVIRRQAGRARVPASELTALAILHEQERCLRRNGSTVAPFTAERRLARKLGRQRLFDLLYAQVTAGRRYWRIVHQAVVILRDQGELAPQRGGQPPRNHVGPLDIEVCRSCLKRNLAETQPDDKVDGLVECPIRFDMAHVEAAARDWDVPLTRIAASVLVHEQEHCVRDPDDREIGPLAAERRLAQKLGDARLLEFAGGRNDQLDPTGHWKD